MSPKRLTRAAILALALSLFSFAPAAAAASEGSYSSGDGCAWQCKIW